jgi:BlaI family penicillinase repressor
MPNRPQISDAEWQVMHVVWGGEPLPSQEVVARLAGQSDWSPATIKTMLHRLVKKGALAYKREGNRYLYRAKVRQADCVLRESRSFLERVFDGQAAPMLAWFVRSGQLSRAEIDDLRRILDEEAR